MFFRKKKKEEDPIALYNEKRCITVRKFFEIVGYPMPERFNRIAGTPIHQFAINSQKLTGDSVVFCWDMPFNESSEQNPVEMAATAGALVVISNRPYNHPSVIYIEDPDNTVVCNMCIKTLAYIRSLHKAKVITVTGSIGKTSTKEMIESVLRTHYKNPVISKGNNNSIPSVAKNIQSLKRTTNVMLQEVGAFCPGAVEIPARILAADMTVYTNITFSHLDLYGTVENILKDKASLSEFGKPGGISFINYDDPMLRSHPFRQKVITFSLDNPGAMYFAKNIEAIEYGYSFTLTENLDGAQPLEFSAQVHALGHHNILNAVAAFAVGRALKLDPAEILTGIDSFRVSGLRQNLVRSAGYRVFADCYNANKMSIESSLSTLDQIPVPEGGRRIAVLGDILALGDIHEEVHRDVGKTIAAHKVDKLLCYGIDARFICEEAAKDGVDAEYYSSRELLEDAIKGAVTRDDVILFKASHGVNLGATMDRIFGTDLNESVIIGHKQFRLKTIGDFEFYIFETGASLKTYLGRECSVTVPGYVNAEVTNELTGETAVKRLAVEKIGKTAFHGASHVKEVILPPTVVRIRDSAFKGSGLTSFTAPTSLLSVGSEAFADCPALGTVTFSDRNVDLGNNVFKGSPNVHVTYAEG